MVKFNMSVLIMVGIDGMLQVLLEGNGISWTVNNHMDNDGTYMVHWDSLPKGSEGCSSTACVLQSADGWLRAGRLKNDRGKQEKMIPWRWYIGFTFEQFRTAFVAEWSRRQT